MSTTSGILGILVVCTGNMCRSPTAAALLARRLEAEGVAASVQSAGLVREGDPVPQAVLAVGSDQGLDLSGHRARKLVDADLSRVDLLLGMAREHVREAVVEAPHLWPRAFTLKEIVRRGRDVGPRRLHESLGGWLDRVHEGRRTADLLGTSELDDIEDPMGGSLDRFEEMFAELDALVNSLIVLAWPRYTRDQEAQIG